MLPDIALNTVMLFMSAVLVLNITPGPDMMFCLGSGLNGGSRAGVAAAVGGGLGAFVHVIAVTAGISTLVLTYPVIFDGLRLFGAAYLFWLAWKTLKSPGPLSTVNVIEATSTTTSPPASLRPVFWRGAITCFLNPKIILFFIAFLPQFIRVEAGSIPLQLAIFGSLVVVSAIIVNSLVGMSAGRVLMVLRRYPRAAELQSWIVASIFGGLAVKLLLTKPS